MNRPLTVHVQDDPALAPDLRVDAAWMRAVLDAADLRDVVLSDAAGAGGLPDNMADAQVLFTTTKLDFSDHAVRAPRLRLVQTMSAGVEAFLKTLPAHITLCNASGVHGDKAAEFILSALLMLNFHIPRFVDDRTARLWKPAFGGPVAGKCVVMLGAGAIGGAAIARLQGFGLRIVAVTRGGEPVAGATRSIPVRDLDTVLPEADFFVSTLPLTPGTKRLISRERLSRLKPGAGLVSVGRADIFDNDALLEFLHDGRIGGAVLDVFPVEPLPQESPFWTAPRLIVTPHCSLDDHTHYRDACLDIFIDNLRRYRDGRPLRNQVDPALGY